MRLVKQGKAMDDRYVRILDGAEVPDEGPVILPAARLLADGSETVKRSGATGVLWPNDRKISELAPYLDRLALVALVFPNFKDGRAYSQARILREQYRFRGELRATGQVLRDQFLFLHRAGFDAFEVLKPADAASFVQTIDRFSVFYQPASDGRPTAFRKRVSDSAPLAVQSGAQAPNELQPCSDARR